MAGVVVAEVRMNFASPGGTPLVPVAAGGVLPGWVEPAVPVGFGFAAFGISVGIAGAAIRQPVTVILLSELAGVVCGVGVFTRR